MEPTTTITRGDAGEIAEIVVELEAATLRMFSEKLSDWPFEAAWSATAYGLIGTLAAHMIGSAVVNGDEVNARVA